MQKGGGRVQITCKIAYVLNGRSLLGREVKRNIFHHAILIQHIFHKNALGHLRFGKLMDKVHMEGTVSQIFHLGFSFSFM